MQAQQLHVYARRCVVDNKTRTDFDAECCYVLSNFARLAVELLEAHRGSFPQLAAAFQGQMAQVGLPPYGCTSVVCQSLSSWME